MARYKFRVGGRPSKCQTTTLYRLYSAEGSLLYVGVSHRAELRICCQHLVDKHWYREVEMAKFEHFDSRAMAECMERDAIRREAPLYNVAHNEMPYGGREGAWNELHKRLERKRDIEEFV